MRRKNVGFNTSEKRLEAKGEPSRTRPPKEVIESEKYFIFEIINHEFFAKDYQYIEKVTEFLDKHGGLEEYKKTLTFKFYFGQIKSSSSFQLKLIQRDRFISDASGSEGLLDVTRQPKFIKKGIERCGGVDSFLFKLRSCRNNIN